MKALNISKLYNEMQPMIKFSKELQESPMIKIVKELQESPMIKLFKELQESPITESLQKQTENNDTDCKGLENEGFIKKIGF